MELIIIIVVMLLLWGMAKGKVDEAVATVNAERPDKEPVSVNSWVDSGCLVLLLIVFVVGAVTLLGD
jgi:hypothetical protein